MRTITKEQVLEITGNNVTPSILIYAGDSDSENRELLSRDILEPFFLDEEQLEIVQGMFPEYAELEPSLTYETTPLDFAYFVAVINQKPNQNLLDISQVLLRFINTVDLMNAERNSAMQVTWTYGGWNGKE